MNLNLSVGFLPRTEAGVARGFTSNRELILNSGARSISIRPELDGGSISKKIGVRQSRLPDFGITGREINMDVLRAKLTSPREVRGLKLREGEERTPANLICAIASRIGEERFALDFDIDQASDRPGSLGEKIALLAAFLKAVDNPYDIDEHEYYTFTPERYMFDKLRRLFPTFSYCQTDFVSALEGESFCKYLAELLKSGQIDFVEENWKKSAYIQSENSGHMGVFLLAAMKSPEIDEPARQLFEKINPLFCSENVKAGMAEFFYSYPVEFFVSAEDLLTILGAEDVKFVRGIAEELVQAGFLKKTERGFYWRII